jgi:hypothetical protein
MIKHRGLNNTQGEKNDLRRLAERTQSWTLDNLDSRGKADALKAAEGSRPAGVMASRQVTTGVLDQGMCSKG